MMSLSCQDCIEPCSNGKSSNFFFLLINEPEIKYRFRKSVLTLIIPDWQSLHIHNLVYECFVGSVHCCPFSAQELLPSVLIQTLSASCFCECTSHKRDVNKANDIHVMSCLSCSLAFCARRLARSSVYEPVFKLS